MTNISDTSLISVLSVKGGTGKTTTTLCLASLLAEKIPTTIIEGQRENPQYRTLLFPQHGNEMDTITSVRDSPVFQNRSVANNISLIPLTPPKKRRQVELERRWGARRFLKDYTYTVDDFQLNVDQQAQNIEAISKHFDDEKHLVMIDYDAGLDKRNSKEVLPFHRAVHGYGFEQWIKEYAEIRGFDPIKDKEQIFATIPFVQLPTFYPYPLHFDRYGKLAALPVYREEEYSEEGRFGKGLLIFVSSPAMAEIKGLVDRSFFFRDLGPNNHYVLVINQARSEDVEEIDSFLREKMGDSYMFGDVFGLPQVPYMEFGNMIAGGNSYLLPTRSDSPRYEEYKTKLSDLADTLYSKYI